MSIDAKSINIHMQVTGNFPAQVAASGAAMQTFGNQAHAGMAKAQSGMAKFGAVASKVGTGAMIGVAIGLALSAKAAIAFESSFAGVRKTVEATEPTFQRLAMDVRELAKEIPIGVNELNRIMELGGQLGVDAGGLLAFTETIALIGVTTTLSTDEAALGFARLDNIMQLGGGSFDRIGSSIVGLGNNFAATEDEILRFALRIAPIGKTVGATTDDVLAIATAFTSVGIPAERGGTAIQKVLLRISDAAIDGGAALGVFAEVANMTIEDFQELAKTDPAAAFESFIIGLQRVIESGESTTPIFEALNLSNERVRNSMLAMANAAPVLSAALDGSEQSWLNNLDLVEEAEKRFETFASQLGIFKNKIVDVGIGIGQGLLPWLGDLLIGFEMVSGWIGTAINWFNGLNGTVKTLTISALALTTAMWAMSAHPLMLAIGAVAGVIALIGKNARESKQRVEGLNAVLALGADFDSNTLDTDFFFKQIGEKNFNTLRSYGFKPSDIADAIFGTQEERDEFARKAAIGWETTLTDAKRNQLSAYERVGHSINPLIGAADPDFNDAINSINKVAEATERLKIERLALQRAEIRLEIRSIVGEDEEDIGTLMAQADNIEPILLDNLVVLPEESIKEIRTALSDYEGNVREGLDGVAEAVQDSINALYEFDDEFERAWGEIFATLNRQMDAVFDFEDFIDEEGFSPVVEHLLRSLAPSPQDKEVILEAWRTGLFPDKTTWDEWEAQLVGTAGRLARRVIKEQLEAVKGFEFLFGDELLAELARIAKEVSDDDSNTYSFGEAYMATLEEAFNTTRIKSVRDRIMGVLEVLLLDPEQRGELGLTRQAVQDLIDELNKLDPLYTTTIRIVWAIDDRPDNLPFNPIPNIKPSGTRRSAFGGSLMRDQTSLVGEYGPELFRPYTSGTIIPNSKLNSGGKTTTIEVNIIRPETSDLPGDISEGLVRAGIAEQIDLVGAF